MKRMAIYLILCLSLLLSGSQDNTAQAFEPVRQTGAGRNKIARQRYSQHYLKQLMNQIDRKVNGLDRRHPLRLSMTMWGAGSNNIDVWLNWNTPEIRRLFRMTVLDSPAVTFHGPSSLKTDSAVGISEVDSVALWTEYPVYSTRADSVNILLTNCGNGRMAYGQGRLMYEAGEGDWRQMPRALTAIHYDEEYTWFYGKSYVWPRTTKCFTVWLMPAVYHNQPGRYRFLQNVRIGEKKDTLLMTEFRLSDKEQEWKDIMKTTVPQTVQDIDSAAVLPHWGLDTTPDSPAEFPGGQKALTDYLTLNTADFPRTKPGTVVLIGIITWDGQIDNVRVKTLDDNHSVVYAERRVRQMPRWKPAMYHGSPVYSRIELSVVFK